MKLTTFKKVDINVDEEGVFSCNVEGYIFQSTNFEQVKKFILEKKEEYYTITKSDYTKMLAKLSPREREFINELMEAYYCHLDNAYCELGGTMENFKVEGAI